MTRLAVPLGPREPGPVRPDLTRLPEAPVTRFAPAPTGYLHLGHLVNAIYVWGLARSTNGTVLVRIEDHDRQRSRRAFEAAIHEDLDQLGLAAGGAVLRQSDDATPYAAALAILRAQGRIYACDCARAALLAWRGPGCPGGCAARDLPQNRPGVALRADLGGGDETFDDALAGPWSADVAPSGDLTVRDRHGNWSYSLCVVVDDARQHIGLVVRGRDLLGATPAQVRLGRLLGLARPAAYLHHPLLRRPSGAKLSKSDGDTGIRELLASGVRRADLFGFVAAAVGLLDAPRPVEPDDLAGLFGA